MNNDNDNDDDMYNDGDDDDNDMMMMIWWVLLRFRWKDSRRAGTRSGIEAPRTRSGHLVSE